MEETDRVFQEELEKEHLQRRQAAQEQLQLMTKEEAKSSIKLSNQEYKKISQALIQIMKNLLATQPNQKVTSELLSLHLIERQLNEFTQIEQMQKQEKIIRGVIKRLTEKEKIFQMVVDENGQEILRLHPTYLQ